jgi:hypothetical protein
MYRIGLLFFFTMLVFSACNKKTVPVQSSAVVSEKNAIDFSAKGYKKGTIVDMTGLDGCGFMIKLENGKTLEPNQLDAQFKKKNLPVWVKYSIPKSVFSICMAGQLINLTAIENRGETRE